MFTVADILLGEERNSGVSVDWESSRARPHVLLHPGDPLAEHKSEILDWIEAVCGEKVPRDQPFEEVLRDGVILCNMMNKLLPGSVQRIRKDANGSDGQLTENHAAIRHTMKELGVPEDEIFETADLFEARNIKQVVKSLTALARVASNKPDFEGPEISPKAPVLFHWKEQELRVVTPGTSKFLKTKWQENKSS